mmetsp:Transcript_25712/g.74378  ORF Transcript_25712/g.74378 Transcript_25712/m.74378 type:complete len:306 (+) Transcript_25712:132-1049(+)
MMTGPSAAIAIVSCGRQRPSRARTRINAAHGAALRSSSGQKRSRATATARTASQPASCHLLIQRIRHSRSPRAKRTSVAKTARIEELPRATHLSTQIPATGPSTSLPQSQCIDQSRQTAFDLLPPRLLHSSRRATAPARPIHRRRLRIRSRPKQQQQQLLLLQPRPRLDPAIQAARSDGEIRRAAPAPAPPPAVAPARVEPTTNNHTREEQAQENLHIADRRDRLQQYLRLRPLHHHPSLFARPSSSSIAPDRPRRPPRGGPLTQARPRFHLPPDGEGGASSVATRRSPWNSLPSVHIHSALIRR